MSNILDPLLLTLDQCLRARDLLWWSRYRLVALTGMQEGTIRAFEKDRVSSTPGTLLTLRRVLEEGGVEFLANGTVRFRERRRA